MQLLEKTQSLSLYLANMYMYMAQITTVPFYFSVKYPSKCPLSFLGFFSRFCITFTSSSNVCLTSHISHSYSRVGAASVYIQSIHWIPSKSRLWLYFNVFRKSDLWHYGAILLFFSAKIATFWAINVKVFKTQLEYFCTQLLYIAARWCTVRPTVSWMCINVLLCCSAAATAKVLKLSFEYLHIYSPKGDFFAGQNGKIASLL